MVATNSQSADELAAPLDLLLTSFGARHGGPDDAQRRVEQVRRSTSPTTPHRGFASSIARSGTVIDRRGSIGDGTGEGRQAVRRPGVAGQSVAAPHDAGLPCDQQHGGSTVFGRQPRLAGCRANPVCVGLPHRRAFAEQQPGAQPAGLEGAHRHRRAQRGAGLRHFVSDMASAPAGAVDGGARRVHAGRDHRGHPGIGGLSLPRNSS